MINWSDLFKIKIANSSKEFQHHEVVKLLLVMKLIEKHRRNKTWIRIYTEHELDNGLKCDVYYENIKEKSVIIYEIQKNYTKKWLKEKIEAYKDYEVPFMKTVDFIPIDLNKLSKNVEQLNDLLDEYIY